MELKSFNKVRDGKYLKNYELIYENKLGREKKYEIVSRRDLKSADDIGAAPSGVSIFATCSDKMLLLHEFRMGVNKLVYNLCAGMLEEGETIEQCIARELYEETGLKLKKIKKILPPSYAALAISDVTTYIAIVEIEDGICTEDNTSSNEEITASLYTRDEVKNLLETESFSSRAQLAAYFFAYGKHFL
jgi:NADH pyrophosphatase NudC (nudix superfamily)